MSTTTSIPPESTLPTLQHLSSLIHLSHHRNKNQHRHSLWYRPFTTFRSNLSSLIRDLETLYTIPSSHAAKAKKKATDPAVVQRIRARLDHWRDFLVPKWHLAFSQVIADQRFSALGLFLMAALAEVCQVVGISRDLEDQGDEEVRKAIEALGQEEMGVAISRAEMDDRREDVGEVVRRDQVEEGQESRVDLQRTKEKTNKKKRKIARRDAIDDIFG